MRGARWPPFQPCYGLATYLGSGGNCVQQPEAATAARKKHAQRKAKMKLHAPACCWTE